jgi:transposase
MPRPRKLTIGLRERMATAVSAGSSYRAAAQAAGIGESTLHSWLARGRAEQDARRHNPAERAYVLLLQAVEQASAGAEVRAAKMITEAAGTDWRAALAFLERRDPENWGKRLAVEHTGTNESAERTFDQLLDLATDEELELLQEVAERVRNPG